MGKKHLFAEDIIICLPSVAGVKDEGWEFMSGSWVFTLFKL